MGKRHQASRRRTYGRRQHEMHERTERYAGSPGWLDAPDTAVVGGLWEAEPSGRAEPARWLQARGIV
jgi:hypothetical protein